MRSVLIHLAVLALTPAGGLAVAQTKPDEREARLAAVEPEFSTIYRLDENEVLRHVPEPLDRELRWKWYSAIFGRDRRNEMEIVSLYVQWKDGRPQWKGASVGSAVGGIPFRAVLPRLGVVSWQYIEGEEDLLDRRIAGDWIFDPKAPPEKIVAAMQAVLRKHWGHRVNIEFREIERDVYVVHGEWAFKPISGDFPDVQIYGSYLDKNSGAGGACGDFDKFLRAVGSWIEMPIVNETSQPMPNRLCWRFHVPSPVTQQQWHESHDPERVTSNLTEQTGLEFVKKRRKTRILFVERQKGSAG